jgi:hypothetical protein
MKRSHSSQHVAGVVFGIIALVNTGVAAADREANTGARGRIGQAPAARPD